MFIYTKAEEILKKTFFVKLRLFRPKEALNFKLINPDLYTIQHFVTNRSLDLNSLSVHRNGLDY